LLSLIKVLVHENYKHQYKASHGRFARNLIIPKLDRLQIHRLRSEACARFILASLAVGFDRCITFYSQKK
jgi:hypothetical protein